MNKTFIRKLSTCIIAIIAIAVMSICFVGCNKGGNQSDTNNKIFAKTSNILGLSVASSANILSTLNTNTPTPTAKIASMSSVTDSQLSETDIARINSQIQMFEMFIGENPITTLTEQSDNESYKHKITYTLKDLSGTSVNYVMYYNETQIAQDNDNDDDDDDDENDFDNEQEFSIDGIMIVGEQEYKVIGEKELEDGEYELYVRASIDKDNYIEIKQEIEDDEQEFVYKIFKNGSLVNKFDIEIEQESNEISLVLKTIENGENVVRSFDRETENGKTVIKIIQQQGNNNYAAKVFITQDEQGNNVYKYVLPNGVEYDQPDID